MEFDNENSRCVSAGPEPDARVCVILRGEEVEIELKGRRRRGGAVRQALDALARMQGYSYTMFCTAELVQ